MPDSIVTRLASWYAGEKHRYDFRAERNAYRTWITEIFLQQTQIAAGKNKLKAFLRNFPDVKSLAKASPNEVLAAFKGMGYYSRARNMHKAAQTIVTAHSGVVPTDFATLVKIPGIGRYTAAMIASIHGQEKILALDANHARVLARLFEIEYIVGSEAFRTAAMQASAPFFSSLMKPGDANEALMQWGQTICKKLPQCEKCFAPDFCAAHAAGTERLYPKKAARTQAAEILWIMLLYRRGEKYQTFVNDGELPFLKGELMFPAVLAKARLPEKIPPNIERKILSRAQGEQIDFKHAITHHAISVKLVFLKEALPGGKYYSPKEMQALCHSSLMQKAIRRLDKLEFD